MVTSPLLYLPPFLDQARSVDEQGRPERHFAATGPDQRGQLRDQNRDEQRHSGLSLCHHCQINLLSLEDGSRL